MNLGARWHQARIGYNKGTLTTTYKVYSSTPHPLFTWRPNDPNQQTFRILIDYCWSMDGALLRMITFSLPPSSHQPVSPHFVVHGRKASPDRPDGADRPPFLRYLSFFSFIWRDSSRRRHRPHRARDLSVPRSTSVRTHYTIHSLPPAKPSTERGLEAASSVLH